MVAGDEARVRTAMAKLAEEKETETEERNGGKPIGGVLKPTEGRFSPARAAGRTARGRSDAPRGRRFLRAMKKERGVGAGGDDKWGPQCSSVQFR